MNPIKPSQDVVPLTKFRAHVSEYIKQVQQSERPIVITQHGSGSAVLLKAEVYEELLDQIEYLRSIGRGLAQSATGKGISHEEAMASLRKTIDDADKKQRKRKKNASA